LDRTNSVFEIGDGACRLYIRYSKVHANKKTFYGLREEDLRQLSGYNSIVCFLWDGQKEPLFVPFSDYEEVFRSVPAAGDGQFKAQVYFSHGITELYVARAGRFNVESHYGWAKLDAAIDSSKITGFPQLSHSQVQRLLGGIGAIYGYDISVPPADCAKLDWSLSPEYSVRAVGTLPVQIREVVEQVDVVWSRRGSNNLVNLFKVEHSTPIYSGLLRLNDVHLALPSVKATFNIVANDERRAAFLRQLSRPTFQASGIRGMCSFLGYSDVYGWHSRTLRRRREESDARRR
jgi:hypothetical protein